MSQKLLLTLICALSSLMSWAQQSSAQDLLRNIDQRFVTLDSLIFHTPASAQSPYSATLVDIDTIQAREKALDAAIANRVNAEIGAFKSNLGLQLTGQTYYRLDGSIGFDEDDPQSRYNAKMQVEARWYILQSSLFKRKGNIQAIEIQGDIDRTLQERDRLELSVYRQKEYFRQCSDSLLAGILQHRILNLDLLTRANLYLLERGDISSDELLNILDTRAEAERQLATLRPGMPFASDLSEIRAYTITVDTTAMIRYISDTAVDIKLLRLRLQLLQQQQDNTSYWSQCNLAPFVRYSYYVRDYAANSANVDAGVSFTIPINNTASHQRRVLQARRTELEAENTEVMRQVIDKVNYYASEIERLNRASEGEVRRMYELKGYLSMRGYAYDNRLGEYNRLARLKEYNNYLVCAERLIAFQYQRDCYVADLQRLLNTGSVLDFCTERPIEAPTTSTLTTP